MSKWGTGLSLGLILLVAAGLRLTGLDWDEYYHYHPDERFIAWVATSIESPARLSQALQPRLSSFNPYYWPADAASRGIVVPQDAPRRFAYGHLPLYAGVLATRLAERLAPIARLGSGEDFLTRDVLNGAGRVEFHHLAAVGRFLTALIDLGTVALVFGLGGRLFGRGAGLLAAALLALNVMHIQLSHFFIVDPFLTFFAVAALLCLTLALTGRTEAIEAKADRVSTPAVPAAVDPGFRARLTRHGDRWLLLAAVATGFAVGSKFSAVLLLLSLAAAAWQLGWLRHWNGRWRLIGLLAVAGGAFALTNPFAVLDWTCTVVSPAVQIGPLRIPALDWRSCFLDNLARQQAMVSGAADLGFTRQYAGTVPYLYFLEMQSRWGMGPLLFLTALAGFLWGSGRGTVLLLGRSARIRRRLPASWRRASIHPAELAILAWTLTYFLSTGAFFVKFMRYMQPLVPLWTIYGAAILWRWSTGGGARARFGRLATGLVVLVTGLYALSFANLYGTPHPWNSASRWIFGNVAPGALIAVEQWDDPLPTSLRDADGFLSRRQYRETELTWLTGPDQADSPEKLLANARRLAQADYLVIASNRVYGVVARQPDRFPLSSQFHRRLFGGNLGYELVFVTGRAPNLAGRGLWPDPFVWAGLDPPAVVAAYLAERGFRLGRADESFTVYDQPLVMIWRNRDRLAPAEIVARFSLPAGVEPEFGPEDLPDTPALFR